MNGKEVMECRKVKAVIRYHTPNKTKDPEQYFHHLLMLYYPWRQETDLIGTEQTYMSKFYEPDVQTMVQHRNIFEPDSDTVTEALDMLRKNDLSLLHSYDAMNDQENEDLQSQIQDDSNDTESFNNQLSEHLAQRIVSNEHARGGVTTSYTQPLDICDDDLRQSVRSFNTQQRYAYDKVLCWCRNKVKNLNSLKQINSMSILLLVSNVTIVNSVSNVLV